MNADRYQTEAARTLIDKPQHEIPGHDMMLVWVALGLTGEAGEVAEHVKKGVLHQHGIDRDKLVKELGDVAWYLAGLATLIGVPLSEVFYRNIAKLRERYPNGYSSEDSKARVDTNGHATVQQLLDQHSDIPVRVRNAILRNYYGGDTLRRDDRADLFLALVRRGDHRSLKNIGKAGMEILQYELVTRGAAPPSRG